RSLCALGRYDEAERLAQLGRELGDERDASTQAAWRQVKARVQASRGEHAEAETLAREAVTIFEPTDAINVQGEALCDLAEVLAAVEHPLAGAEQDRRDVERELVDDPGNEGLAHGRGPTRDVDAALAGHLTRLCVSGVEAVRDEVEDGPAFHLDRLVGVMGE